MKISTLGPRNTNSQFAAEHYLKDRAVTGEVTLRMTPEEAIEDLIDGEADRAVLCIVYPALNDIVFRNLDRIRIEEVFAYDTDNMVVARRKNDTGTGGRCCSHPAPKHLLPEGADDITLVSSNSYAARLVKDGAYDMCVTTMAAVKEFDLNVVKDYGPVPMGWAVFDRT